MSDGTVSITCTTASGKTLQELSRLIDLRAKRLGELYMDAVIATAIDVLVSLRSDTRRATEPPEPTEITRRGDLHLSWRGKTGVPVLRTGSTRGPEFHGSFFFAEKGMDLKNCGVYRVVSRHERIRPYYVVAPSADAVKKFAAARDMRGIEKKGGLAKTALGIAMAKISTRNSADDSPEAAKILGSKLSHITIYGASATGASGEFGLQYRDDLNYAVPALRSGASGIDTAMQKAANKIAGMITHAAHKAGDFEHDIPSPFPDVKRRK